MNGTYVDINNGRQSFKAYLTVPETGHGPGIILCQEIFGVNEVMRKQADYLAEEGYTVIVPDLYWRQQRGVELGYTPEDFEKAFKLYTEFSEDLAIEDIQSCIQFLSESEACISTEFGIVGYCLGGKLAYLAGCRLAKIKTAVSYYGVGIEKSLSELNQLKGTLILHMPELDEFCPESIRHQIINTAKSYPDVQTFVYPAVGHAFARVGEDHYNKPASDLAHGRTIAALRKALGPDYDLEALWEEHVCYEFETRNVPQTMATMVAEPYVNHIPTMTGGVGYAQLSRFYRHHFIYNNPKDMALTPISRTVGASQLVDEFIMSFTHDEEIDWLIPGIKPTGKFVQIPMLGVIKFRGPKLCHEHIYWDQASVLVQLGILNPQGLPIAGEETALKLLDERLPSNTLMDSWASSEGKAID
nr:dienelactone hydrolase family protein [Acinetobacter sp. Marseille-Q1620]